MTNLWWFNLKPITRTLRTKRRPAPAPKQNLLQVKYLFKSNTYPSQIPIQKLKAKDSNLQNIIWDYVRWWYKSTSKIQMETVKFNENSLGKRKKKNSINNVITNPWQTSKTKHTKRNYLTKTVKFIQPVWNRFPIPAHWQFQRIINLLVFIITLRLSLNIVLKEIIETALLSESMKSHPTTNPKNQ